MSLIFNFGITVNFILFCLFGFNHSLEPLEIADYAYPKKSDTDYFRVAIFATNDLHGRIFPYHYFDYYNKLYYGGGSEYIYKYAQILREEWGDQFLWLDGGDMFQGGMECALTNQTIMNDFYNFCGLDAAAIGNHDFDYGAEHLKNFYKNSTFKILAANVYDKNESKYLYEFWPNVEPYMIKTIGKIKIGIIGLATQETISFSSMDLSNLEFQDYITTTVKYSEILRKEKNCHAVIVLSHFGPKCEKDEDFQYYLRMWDKDIDQPACSNNEYSDFVNNLPPGTIDGVVAGHVHDLSHHYINDIPVVQTDGFTYSHVMYLPFEIKGDEITLINEEIKIEGPLPSCTKIWPDSKRCEYRTGEFDSNVMVDYKFHGVDVKIEEDLAEILKENKEIIEQKYNNVYGYTYDEMSLDDLRETMLSNFVVDIGRKITQSDVCFYNLGGYRSSWHRGNLSEVDLYNMFPFDNYFVSFEMTGSQVVHLFSELSGSSIYPQGGALQIFKLSNSYYELLDMTLFDGDVEIEINPKKIYRVCTNDFLAGGGSGFGKVKKWYPQNINEKTHCIVRDGISKYLKTMKVIKEEYFVDKNHPRYTIIKN